MAETIGSRLRATRESKGMSIEDVAFETRIHASSIRSLEADDYSNFASTTYAKSFLSLYSRYLGVDAAEALHYFAGSDEISLGGNRYLSTIQPIESAIAPSKKTEQRESKKSPTVRRDKPGLAPILLGLIVLLLLAGIPLLWFLGKDASSIDDVTSKAKELAEATRGEISSTESQISGELNPGASLSPTATASTELPKPEAKGDTPTLGSTRREVAADWVLEEPAPVRPTQTIESPSAESTLDEKPIEIKTNPIDSPNVVVAVPTLDKPEPEIPATPAFPANRAVPLVATPSAEPSTEEPEQQTSVTEEKPKTPEESPRTPVVIPLRAVPFVAQPETTDEVTGSEGASDDDEDEDENFVDPANRFPRPLN